MRIVTRNLFPDVKHRVYRNAVTPREFNRDNYELREDVPNALRETYGRDARVSTFRNPVSRSLAIPKTSLVGECRSRLLLPPVEHLHGSPPAGLTKQIDSVRF